MKKNWPWIVPLAIWVSLPWFFWWVGTFHKLDHADPFWLPAIPVMMVSMIPALLFPAHHNDGSVFAVADAVNSSTLNLVVGLLIVLAFWPLKDRRRG